MEIRPIFSSLLRSKTAPLLVALQVALSLAILANALHIVNLRASAWQRPSGIADEANVGAVFSRPLTRRPHSVALAEQRREHEALRAIPGVDSVAWTAQMPLSRSGSAASIRKDANSPQPIATPAVYYTQPGFVQTLGLKLVEGRDFLESEVVEKDLEAEAWTANFPKNVIVTRELARLLYGDAPALGRSFFFGPDRSGEVRIVGVVERLQTPQAPPTAAGEYSVLVPWRISLPFSRWAIRAQPGQLDRVLAQADETLRKIAPSPVRVNTRTVLEDRANRYRNEKALAWMLVAVCALLLLVTASGIVGMTSLRVAQRRKQIGVRRALGARSRDIVRYFLTENVLITTAGVAGGALLTLALNQLLIRHLEQGRLPLHYLLAGACALWALGLAAVYGPASRAAKTPPAIATRTA